MGLPGLGYLKSGYVTFMNFMTGLGSFVYIHRNRVCHDSNFCVFFVLRNCGKVYGFWYTLN